MFTGLIETMGTVVRADKDGSGLRLVIAEQDLTNDLQPGDSVAVNGACLTVSSVEEHRATFQVGPETLLKTNLGSLSADYRVNLERPLRVGDELGGHWVQGHVDGVGRIAAQERQGDWQLVWIEASPALVGQMVSKGSVAVDGVSLTIVDVQDNRFSVALIPFTLAKTTLGSKRVGDMVNLETDILGKYVRKSLEAMRP